MYAVVLGTPAFLHLAVCQNDGPSRNGFQSSSVTLDTSKKPWFWDILSILVYSTPLSGHITCFKFIQISGFQICPGSAVSGPTINTNATSWLMTQMTLLKLMPISFSCQTRWYIPRNIPEHMQGWKRTTLTHALLDHRNQWRLLQFPLATLQSLATLCYNIQRCALAAPCPNDPTGQSFQWSPDAGQHTSSKESKLIAEIVGRNIWNNMLVINISYTIHHWQ